MSRLEGRLRFSRSYTVSRRFSAEFAVPVRTIPSIRNRISRLGHCSCPGADMSEVTQLLNAISQGVPHAAAGLLPLVYDELRRLAAARLADEPSGNTLQPTALVHEAYLRLVGSPNGDHWNHRGHFYSAAAEAIRRILVEHARRKQRHKHGGQRRRLSLEVAESMVQAPPED